MTWLLADAKNRFSELFAKALSEGPQYISRRGKERVVVISEKEYEKLGRKDPSFLEHLMNGPSLEGVDFTRDPSPMRDVDL